MVDHQYDIPLTSRLSAAVTASVISAIVSNPLEVLKTRLQAGTDASEICTTSGCNQIRWQNARQNGSLLRESFQDYKEPPVVYRAMRTQSPTTMSVLRQIVQQEGTGVLWRGLRPSLIAAVPTVGIYMPLYDLLRDSLRPDVGHLAPLAAGCVSRSMAVLCVAPLELLRTRMMSVTLTSGVAAAVVPAPACSGCVPTMTWFSAARQKKSLQHLISLWRGAGATLLRDVPFTAIFWSLTEPARSFVLPEVSATTPTASILYANITAAGLSGAFAAAVTTPFDVIKTQQQISTQSATLWQIGSRIYKRRGWKGLFAGVGPRSLRAVPSCAIVVSSYEWLKLQFSNRQDGGRRDSWWDWWCSD